MSFFCKKIFSVRFFKWMMYNGKERIFNMVKTIRRKRISWIPTQFASAWLLKMVRRLR